MHHCVWAVFNYCKLSELIRPPNFSINQFTGLTWTFYFPISVVAVTIRSIWMPAVSGAKFTTSNRIVRQNWIVCNGDTSDKKNSFGKWFNINQLLIIEYFVINVLEITELMFNFKELSIVISNIYKNCLFLKKPM